MWNKSFIWSLVLFPEAFTVFHIQIRIPLKLFQLIEKRRQEFETLHSLVRWADELFTVFIAVNLVVYVAAVCYIVYALEIFGVDIENNLFTYATYTAIMCASAAMVNHEVMFEIITGFYGEHTDLFMLILCSTSLHFPDKTPLT